ncbi:hypothetical protein [Micromonospora schwarzwaldensis]|uniref:hypothetical protein n=1 Tax=Micromonospora sp. DSM 45708 TaxID=3111767 RepID=UPI0031D8293F
MAFRTWGRLLLTALGVSVLAAAGQLGVAYGFGVVRLDDAFVDASVNRWPAQLVWVAWFAAVATVAGAVLTERLARRDDLPGGTTELLSIAGVSALGAIVVAPLCMQPARAAELGGSVDPAWAAGICAVLGAVVGAGAAIAVLLKPPFGWGVAITTGIVWLLALLSVAPTIVANRSLATVRLGVLEPSWLGAPAAQRLAMLLLPTLALLAGGAIGVLARRAGHPPLVGGAAGAAGPVLVAFAYLTAGPGTAADRYQLAPYYGALIAVAAGALGATATSMLPRAGTGDALDPTDILAPLPATAPAPTTPAATAPVPTTAGAPAPAHWDWPETGGSVTPSSAPRHAGSASPADDERQARSVAPAVARHDEDPTRTSPLPGLLPPVRRTSAIDVLAAGRPEPQPSTRPAPADPDTPGTGTSGPGTDGPAASGSGASGTTVGGAGTGPLGTGADTARPGAGASRAAGGHEPADRAPEPVPAPPAAGTDPAAGSPAVAITPKATTKARPKATVTAPGEPTIPAGAEPTADATVEPTEAAPRATRARRSRAAARPTPLTDDATGDPAEAPRTGRAGRARPARSTGEDARPTAATPPAATPVTPVTPEGSPEATDTAGVTRAADAVRATRPAGPAGAADAATTAAGSTGPVPGGTDVPRTGESTDAPEPARRPRSFFFDPEPADRPVTASPRPRFPIFEDATERAGDVRPAWPITPATGRPARPPAATTPATGRDGDDAATRPGSTPRPHHQGLPEPGRSTGWDALATNARPAGPTAPEGAAPAPAGGAKTGATVPEQAGPGSENVDREASRGRHAGTDDAETAGGKPKGRRGLFRRNRAKGDPEPVDETAEPGATTDDEYVDWVAGLASDDNADDARSLRTGRHHRD